MNKNNYEDYGEIPIERATERNIPVNCILIEPDEECGLDPGEDGLNQWVWTADNFMPRRGRIEEGQYEIRADSREAILEAVNKYVVPLYQAAATNLQTKGENYFWEVKP